MNYKFKDESENAFNFINWLKSHSNSFYYSKNFQLKSIPVALLYTKDENRNNSSELNIGFNAIISYKDYGSKITARTQVAGAVKKWVKTLLDDYDFLNVNPRFPSLNKAKVWTPYCNVLTHEYMRSPFRLPFLVFKGDLERIEQKIDQFSNMIQTISKSKNPRQEKKYQDFLIKNDKFLKGNAFESVIREPKFPIPNTKDKTYEPDFFLKPYFFEYSKHAEIMEVKLPTDKFLQRKDFHTNLRSSFLNNIKQVKNYQRYLKNKTNNHLILNTINIQPESISYSILTGRNDERDYRREILEESLDDYNLRDINIITYDDLIERREKLLVGQKLYKAY